MSKGGRENSPCFWPFKALEAQGWPVAEYLLFDNKLIECFLAKGAAAAAQMAEERFAPEYVCVLGQEGLDLGWIRQGEQFEVEEYDGSESLHIIGERPDRYRTA